MSESPIQVLERWEDHGALWRVVHLSDARAIVDLCTCHGERVDVVESDEREFIEFVRSHQDD